MGGLGALCGRVSPPRGGGEALFLEGGGLGGCSLWEGGREALFFGGGEGVPPRGGGEALLGGGWVLSVGGGVCVVPPSVGSSPGFGLPQGVWGGSPALGKGDTPPPPDGDKSLSVGLGAL